ncbi:chemotaxis protein CheD [Aeromonas bivalvium]|uniref:chemotaxis protein CheD n=1 Tax=Aeromonas bivalvium TaxID=440079 RepID=UPI0038D2125F
MKTLLLQPGETLFSQEALVMRTQLGSCVSLTLWHPHHHWGGMCHFMLPGRHPGGRQPATTPDREPLDGKYADEALALLLAAISQAGSDPREYVTKLFGGGNMFPQLCDRHPRDIASQNVAAAWELVRRHGLTVSAHDLGGTGHRSLIFELDSGHVWVRHSPLAPAPGPGDPPSYRTRTSQ